MCESIFSYWRKAGYKIVARGNNIYLIRWPKSIDVFIGYSKENPLEQKSVNSLPWHSIPGGLDDFPPKLAEELMLNAENCYCGQGNIERCDFCTGLRNPSPPESTAGKMLQTMNKCAAGLERDARLSSDGKFTSARRLVNHAAALRETIAKAKGEEKCKTKS